MSHSEEQQTHSWEVAQSLAVNFGVLAPFLTSYVRNLRVLYDHDPEAPQEDKFLCIQNLSRCPSLIQVLTYAAHAFYPDKGIEKNKNKTRALTNIFDARELAAFLGVLMVYRRVLRGCDREIRPQISRFVHLRAEVGGQIGRELPAVGIASGFTVGAGRALGLAVLMRSDAKMWKSYRRYLQKAKLPFDMAEEQKIWGCNHAQVASILFQSVGVGVLPATRLLNSLDSTSLDKSLIDHETFGMRVCALWVESVLESGEPPKIPLDLEYHPLESEVSRLRDKTAEILEAQQDYGWLDKILDVAEEELDQMDI